MTTGPFPEHRTWNDNLVQTQRSLWHNPTCDQLTAHSYAMAPNYNVGKQDVEMILTSRTESFNWLHNYFGTNKQKRISVDHGDKCDCSELFRSRVGWLRVEVGIPDMWGSTYDAIHWCRGRYLFNSKNLLLNPLKHACSPPTIQKRRQSLQLRSNRGFWKTKK